MARGQGDYITSHHTTLQYITLQHITSHHVAIQHNTIYSTLQRITLHCIALYYITLHHIVLHYTTLHYEAFDEAVNYEILLNEDDKIPDPRPLSDAAFDARVRARALASPEVSES